MTADVTRRVSAASPQAEIPSRRSRVCSRKIDKSWGDPLDPGASAASPRIQVSASAASPRSIQEHPGAREPQMTYPRIQDPGSVRLRVDAAASAGERVYTTKYGSVHDQIWECTRPNMGVYTPRRQRRLERWNPFVQKESLCPKGIPLSKRNPFAQQKELYLDAKLITISLHL